MSQYAVLGDITADQFLQKYWQKKPLLIRNAVENFIPPIGPDELAGLSLEEAVESRLVIGDDWCVEHGPFDERRFARLGNHNWTLLVQNVDLWVPEVAALLDHFSFLPRWRIDDIMVSFAADGGSVGPHFDNYDVFLLQGEGQRQWSVGEPCNKDSPLIAHTDLRILADPEFNLQWTLNPGDMLYLPPRYSHHGVALGPCTTFSIGFRAPSIAELLDDLTTELFSQHNLLDHLKDPPLTPEMASQPISPAYLDQIRALINHSLSDDQLLMNWFAQFMTTSKHPDLIEHTAEMRSATIKDVQTGKLTRFVNGEVEEN